MIDVVPRTVIGVMPRGFWFPDPSVRIWTSVPLRPESRSWNSTLIGRVAANQDIRATDAPLAQLAAMLAQRFEYSARRNKTQDRLRTRNSVRSARASQSERVPLVLRVMIHAQVPTRPLGPVSTRLHSQERMLPLAGLPSNVRRAVATVT
jgi:hypothetical protein